MAAHLVSLPEVQRISPLVIRILGGNPSKFTLQGTNTYIVGNGPERVLIDTAEGRPSWIKAVRGVLSEQQASLKKVIITHWHQDHVGGIDHIREAYPGVQIFKCQPAEGQLEILNDQKFSLGGATLRAIHSPGHTTDHMALILEEEDAMFTGDNVLGHGTAVFEDLSSYVKSLANMRQLFSGRAYPGHGPVVEDGKAKIAEYIRHRQQREDQILQVLKSTRTPDEGDAAAAWSARLDSWTSMEIVKVVYKDVPESLHLPANGGVMQVLWKLQEEGRVDEESSTGRWRVKGRPAL